MHLQLQVPIKFFYNCDCRIQFFILSKRNLTLHHSLAEQAPDLIVCYRGM